MFLPRLPGGGGFPRALPPPPRPAFCEGYAPHKHLHVHHRALPGRHSFNASTSQIYGNVHLPHRRALLLREARWSAGTAASAAAAVVGAAVVAAAAVVAVFAQLQPSLVVGAGQQSSRSPTLLRGWGGKASPRCPAAFSSGPPATVVLGWRVLQDPPSISRVVFRTAATMVGWGPGALHCSCRLDRCR